MHILLLEPFFGGSHAAWALGLQRHSRHSVEILSLPGRNWKWRMHGGAITLAERFRAAQRRPDLILATDLLDLTTFLALTREQTASIPVAAYFHENQFAYPRSPEDTDTAQGRDSHYGFINYATALAADRVLFNSAFNRDSLLEGARTMLTGIRDHADPDGIEAVAAKSAVLPLGLDLEALDPHRPTAAAGQEPPLLLWNHRWAHDKNPDAFFRILFDLAGEGLHFRVAVLGSAPKRGYPIFEEARRRLHGRIAHFGYVEDRATYAAWLWAADILPVTSHHDFFGISVMEAMYCGAFPLLPRRQAYPELLPAAWREHCLYESEDELRRRLRRLIREGPPGGSERLATAASEFDWRRMGPEYDRILADIPDRC
ncbi:tRNA-queuosine alpha-mannosyltransferase domain-containing protein [Thiohalorhabdus sp. Cl-TMA]|uniref:tRNA-queuosine alpha-mannosyltransferase n=1 Tax=Thiohalorhabdus methylotrophus TaxID=3242694 RepID=A0ABV4TUD0_9GAMM